MTMPALMRRGTTSRRVLDWVLFALVLAVVWLVAGPVSLGGPASYVIVDGSSMEPTYDNGDLVIARQRPTYDVGDIVVYDAPIDAQFNVIHRVVEPTDGGFVTRGDNRSEPDGWIAPHETIHGSAWIHVPNGGLAIRLLRQPAVIIALVAGLLTFEILKRVEGRTPDAGSSPDVWTSSAAPEPANPELELPT